MLKKGSAKFCTESEPGLQKGFFGLRPNFRDQFGPSFSVSNSRPFENRESIINKVILSFIKTFLDSKIDSDKKLTLIA